MLLLKKTIRLMLYFILGLVLFLAISGFLFLNFSPQFGGKVTEAQKVTYSKSGHFKDNKFQNLIETNMEMGFTKGLKVMKLFLQKSESREPKNDIPVLKIDSTDIVTNKIPRLTWFGHSAFLLELGNKNILIDPMFGNSPSPLPFLGSKRYSKELPIAIEKIPNIDAVLFSHDHYDHLDYGSVMKLKEKVKHFFVPLGVGNHLRKWGVAENKITELDWWQSANLEDISFVCTPARHFSGRGFSDRFSTLWSSWIIKSETQNLYFSGDSGYGLHFKEIGERFGPFDFAMMECGQYNENWDNIHMFPEQTAQAAVDINTKQMMPIHWGAFTLALHAWIDPVERVTKAAKALKITLITPRIGESIDLTKEEKPSSEWWKNI